MNAAPRIEDNFEDILSKAMRGLNLDIAAVAKRAGLTSAVVRQLLSGQFNESAIRRIAPILNLNGDCLVQLTNSAMSPSINLPAGITLHNTAFPIPGYAEMTVNSYSLVPPGKSDEGCLVDAGAPFESIRDSTKFVEVQARGADGTAHWKLFLTHTHADHVTHYEELSRIATHTYTPIREPYLDAQTVREGDSMNFGPWQLTAIETPGHSPGGMSYLLEGAETPVVFVGDALFCYSIGKVAEAYEFALAQIRRKILNMPEETILCPGHGPLTTVAFERSHNPFFAS
jgi:glyoxylase-like metal-dependent hydrolase (beta-lactamase superfamily II)